MKASIPVALSALVLGTGTSVFGDDISRNLPKAVIVQVEQDSQGNDIGVKVTPVDGDRAVTDETIALQRMESTDGALTDNSELDRPRGGFHGGGFRGGFH